MHDRALGKCECSASVVQNDAGQNNKNMRLSVSGNAYGMSDRAAMLERLQGVPQQAGATSTRQCRSNRRCRIARGLKPIPHKYRGHPVLPFSLNTNISHMRVHSCIFPVQAASQPLNQALVQRDM